MLTTGILNMFLHNAKHVVCGWFPQYVQDLLRLQHIFRSRSILHSRSVKQTLHFHTNVIMKCGLAHQNSTHTPITLQATILNFLFTVLPFPLSPRDKFQQIWNAKAVYCLIIHAFIHYLPIHIHLSFSQPRITE
jgi:hypothetical protein